MDANNHESGRASTPCAPILSILTPSIHSRLRQVDYLCSFINRQIIDPATVEHLVLVDNKSRTVGEKRDALLRIARGDYVAFVDDDDWISADYVPALVAAAKVFCPSVITFLQEATINLNPTETQNQKAIIEFKLGNPNEPFRETESLKKAGTQEKEIPGVPREDSLASSGFVRRNAWHICAWRREIAITSKFPSTNYGEDWAFAAPLCAMKNMLTEHHIPEVLHYYRHDIRFTDAPPPKN